jgi:hypothetical protein
MHALKTFLIVTRIFQKKLSDAFSPEFYIFIVQLQSV